MASSEVASLDRVGTVLRVSEGIEEPRLQRKKTGLEGEKSLQEVLGLLYDDGCGNESVIDFLDAAKGLIRPDGGPPRWFCPVECGRPVKGSPVLLYLPGN